VTRCPRSKLGIPWRDWDIFSKKKKTMLFLQKQGQR